jgi:hypothetical protein
MAVDLKANVKIEVALRIAQIIEEYSLSTNEIERLDWVLSTFEVNEHDSEIAAELKDILAARKLASMPKLTSAEIKRAKAKAIEMGLTDFAID